LFLPLAIIVVLLPFSEVLAIVSGSISYICAALVAWRLAPLISIRADLLQVGKAAIPTKFLGAAHVVKTQEAFVERGRNLNPLAFTKFQIGVNQMTKVEIRDLADPTPYWLFSTRNPELVASYLKKIS
jgi:hypothetical protein